MGTDAYLVTAAVVAFAGVVQMATGFGFALVTVPLLALAVDAHTAVLVALMVGVLGNTYQAVTGRGHRDHPVMLRILAGAALGLPAGFLVFALADARVLKLVIGVAVLAAVAYLLTGVDLRRASWPLDVGAGFLSGALTTSVGTNGPPLVFVLHARHFDPDRFRATITATFVTLDVVSIAVFAVSGRITSPTLLAALVAVPGLLVGLWTGRQVRRLVSPEGFRVIVLVLLTLTGASAVLTAL